MELQSFLSSFFLRNDHVCRIINITEQFVDIELYIYGCADTNLALLYLEKSI